MWALCGLCERRIIGSVVGFGWHSILLRICEEWKNAYVFCV